MKPLVKGGAMFFGATLVWQFSNFAFNVVGAHQLGPAKYGILASAMALGYLLNPVVLAVQTVASRESTSVIVDEQRSQIRPIVNYYLTRVGLGALAFSAVVIVLSPFISDGLHLKSPEIVMILALVIPTIVASAIVRGVHQGTRRFERYSLGTLAEGLTKVGGAFVLLVFFWKSPISGMLAVFLSAAAGLVVNMVLLRHFPRPSFAVRVKRHPVRYSVNSLIIFLLLAFLFSVDTMTARLTLSPHAAGTYAGISISGKIVFFASNALGAFLFPIFSTRFDEGGRARRWLALSMLLVGSVSAAIIAVFAWAPYLVTGIILGAKYRSAAHDIWIMGVIFAIYAVTNLFVMYLLARRQRGIGIALAIAVCVQVGGFVMFHRSIDDLMSVMAFALSVALLCCATLIVFGRSWSKSDQTESVPSISQSISIYGLHRKKREEIYLMVDEQGPRRKQGELSTFRRLGA